MSMKTTICLSVSVVFFCISYVAGGNAFRAFFPRMLVNYEDRICSASLGDICIDIQKCSFFTELLDKTPIPRPRSIVRIIKEHQCGFEKNIPKVCCSKTTAITLPTRSISTGTTTLTTTTTPRADLKKVTKEPMFFDTLTEQIYDHPNYPLLPVDRCGPIPQAFRITSGKKTALEEFPWMALIAYRTQDIGIEFRCGGTLINKDYVLTAAHCILNSTLLGVRLGEYDLSSTKKDCDDDNYCAPSVQDFYINDTIIHPKYSPKTFAHDIALIRLSRPANFSTNIQPVCLPVSDLNDDLTGKFAIVAGWGVTEDGHKSSILLKASVPVHNIQTCRRVYNDFAPITDNQICAGGYKGRDSCSGDSGGPLTYTGLVDGIPRYIQYGVVSYGPRECGSDGQPGIYTRVSKYLKWILDNIY